MVPKVAVCSERCRLTVHWSGRVDAAGLARRAFASMRSVQGITAVVGRSIQSLGPMEFL
jgi:hypothetical protein